MLLGWYAKHGRRKLPRKVRQQLMQALTRRKAKGSRSEQWDARVRAFLDQQYSASPHYKASLLALWEKYLSLDLPTEHFVSEFTRDNRATILQRVWEMMVARHLDALGYAITIIDDGPDFRFEHEGRTIWVEAISPTPSGVPEDYMESLKPGEFKVGDVPHNEVLLRWTAALKEKHEKLQVYRTKGIVSGKDAFVVAVNGCQLERFPLQHGISQFPYALEAVYPAGPLTVSIDKATGRVDKTFVSNRWSIKNAQGADVKTNLFLDKNYDGISAVISCSMDRSEEAVLPLDVVHNHVAVVPIARGMFGQAGGEWVTESDGKEGINIIKLPPTAEEANSEGTEHQE
jgi:type I restriction enzyme S subunit